MKILLQNSPHAAATIQKGTGGESRLLWLRREAEKILRDFQAPRQQSRIARLKDNWRDARVLAATYLLTIAGWLNQFARRIAPPPIETPVRVLARRGGITLPLAKELLASVDNSQQCSSKNQPLSTSDMVETSLSCDLTTSVARTNQAASSSKVT